MTKPAVSAVTNASDDEVASVAQLIERARGAMRQFAGADQAARR